MSMNAPVKKQHLIDPEICIRCNTCEETCPVDAVTHDDNNYVVDAASATTAWTASRPARPARSTTGASSGRLSPRRAVLLERAARRRRRSARTRRAIVEALEDEVGALLERGAQGLRRQGGRARIRREADRQPLQPQQAGASRPSGNFRLTAADAENRRPPHHPRFRRHSRSRCSKARASASSRPARTRTASRTPMRLYSVASPRDGEKPQRQQRLAHREARAGRPRARTICATCQGGDKVERHRPVRRDLPDAQRSGRQHPDDLHRHRLGAVPRLHRAAAPRHAGRARQAHPVLRRARAAGAALLRPAAEGAGRRCWSSTSYSRASPARPRSTCRTACASRRRASRSCCAAPHTHVYICGLKGMESGVDEAFADVCRHARRSIGPR